VTACSGTGEFSDRENDTVFSTSVGSCEIEEAELEDAMKGDEERGKQWGRQWSVGDGEK